MIRRAAAVVILVAVFIAMFALQAVAAWPTTTQWIPVMGVDWSYITDPLSDVTPSGHLDLVPDMTSSSGAAAFWYFDGTNLYFRMIVDGDPVKNRGLASAEMLPFGWNVLIESTGDNYPDYAVSVDGTGSADTFHTLYNTGLDVNVDTETGFSSTAIANSAYIDANGFQILINGYVRSKQVTTISSLYYNGNPDYYVDFMVPLTWLARSGGATPPPAITQSTPIKFAFGTGASGQTINKDLAGQSATTNITDLFSSSPPTTIDSAGYGTLKDTLHADSPPGMGIWQVGWTVTVNGYGWPKNSSMYYRPYLNVRIFDPLDTKVWDGQVPCSSSGVVTNAPTVLIESAFVPGIYYILVEDPRHLGSYNLKDTFTVPAPPVILTTSTKTVDKAVAIAGDTLLYTITVRNTGSATANGIVVSDIIPAYVQYVAGSTTAGGSSVADVGGTSPLVGGITLPPLGSGSSYTLTFQATVLPAAPDQVVIGNVASVSYSSSIIPLEAFTTVNAPLILLNKTVDKESAMPGETLVYTISYENVGHANAYSIVIDDIIPLEVTYISCSAAPSGGTYTYQHVTGGPYDTSSTPPITAIRFKYTLTTTPLPPGGTGVFYITVQVK